MLRVVDVQRVSILEDGTQGNDWSGAGEFSPDGIKIVFVSHATNLVLGDTNRKSDILVKDFTTGIITRISTASDGTQGNGHSLTPIFSPDGSKVAFNSDTSNFVPGDTNAWGDIFIKDLTSGEITRISTASDGTQGNSWSYPTHAFSPNGTQIAFSSFASNFVLNDTNEWGDIFIKDLTNDAITRVSTATDGTEGDGWSVTPVFSPDGTKLAFSSTATNLVAGDSNNESDVFIRDLGTGVVSLLSKDSNSIP